MRQKISPDRRDLDCRNLPFLEASSIPAPPSGPALEKGAPTPNPFRFGQALDKGPDFGPRFLALLAVAAAAPRAFLLWHAYGANFDIHSYLLVEAVLNAGKGLYNSPILHGRYPYPRLGPGSCAAWECSAAARTSPHAS